MDDPRDTGSEGPAGEVADDTAEFWVDFPGPSVFDQTPRANPFGLVGDGSVAITKDRIVLTGIRQAPGVTETVVAEVARQRIADLVREGRELSMTILPADADAKPGTLVMRARNLTEAIAISSRLPLDLSPDRAQEVAGQREFNEQLARLAPGTPVTVTLLVVNLAVFVAMALDGAGLLSPDSAVHFRWGSNWGPVTLEGQWWRLWSSNYLHFGLAHVAANMWALFDSGRLVERLYGSFQYFAIYTLAGIAGELAGLHWNANIHSAGASGAILGVLGALMAFMLKPGNRIPKATLRRLFPSTAVFAATSVSSGFIHEGINNAAHIGGLLAGFGAGWLFAVPVDEEGRRRDYRRLGWVLGGAALGLALVALPLHLQHRARVRQREARSRVLTEEMNRLDADWTHWRQGDEAGRWAPHQSVAVLESTVIHPLERFRSAVSAHVRDLGGEPLPMHHAFMEFLERRQASLNQLADARRKSDTLAAAAALRAMADAQTDFDRKVSESQP